MDAVQFVDLANRNYRLASGSPYKAAGTDGKDLGANIDLIDSLMGASALRVPAPPSAIQLQ